ncbi:putative membrane protein [Clostridium sp. CAG:1013]|nr:putative membrane protein [Clostridium sp. CAG:1013]
MRRCENCGVQVAGTRERCPLCGGILNKVSGEEREVYPKVPLLRRKYKKLLFPLFLFSIACCIAAGIVNLVFPQTGFWSLIVLCGVLYLWSCLRTAVTKRGNLPKQLLLQTLFLSVLLLLLDLLTGWRGWSAGYGVPLLSTASMMALAVYYWGFRWEDHHIVQYVALDLLYSAVSAVLFFTGCAGVLWPSLLCMCMGVGSFLAVVLFRRKVILGQLHRGIHL